MNYLSKSLQPTSHTAMTIPSSSLSFQQVASLPNLDQAIAAVAAAYDFSQHPYFVWMQDNQTSRTDFCKSQLPFRFAVESFSQSLAAVLARLPILESRLALADNIAEEHGKGDLQRAHKSTFHQYLKAIGATPDDLRSPCTVSVLAFNQSILNYCLTQPAESSAALLGIIEYLYIDISALIAQTIEQRQWVGAGGQSHYKTHEVLDVAHARDLFVLAHPSWECELLRRQIAQGIILGAHYFWSMYSGLLPI